MILHGPRVLLQILLLTTFLYFFGLPAITRYVRKEVMVVETTKETNGVPFPAITISVVDQIKNYSCFDRNVSVADCLEKVTLNRSDVLKSVILGWSKRQEIEIGKICVRILRLFSQEYISAWICQSKLDLMIIMTNFSSA